jgi:hypothetical protein
MQATDQKQATATALDERRQELKERVPGAEIYYLRYHSDGHVEWYFMVALGGAEAAMGSGLAVVKAVKPTLPDKHEYDFTGTYWTTCAGPDGLMAWAERVRPAEEMKAVS